MKHGKGEATAPTPSTPKMEPRVSINWPGYEEKGPKVKVTGNVSSLGLGKTAKIVVEGPVTGFSMRDYGCSIDLKATAVKIVHVSDMKAEDEGEAMTDMVERMQGKKKE